MIRMIQSTSAGHAKSYFSQALQKADYYIDDQELQGRFYGLLSDRLNLDKVATKDSFFSLCENLNPKTGEALTPRTKEDRTIGYDINFHCPKSVSIVHVLSKDNHIMDAFQQSVHETMQHIEYDSMARVRAGGKYEDRKTGELVYAEFTHQTARPVEGMAPDPHLHSHCFTFNATWDEIEKKTKACQFRDINRDMPYYQARFHKILSDKLIDLGYQIKRTDKMFEIDGVPKGVIDLFSKRTDEIGQVAKEQGITDAKELSDGIAIPHLQDQVLIVDEAGLLGTQDTSALLELVKEKNARLIFVGDTRQHSSITRGDALRVLNTVGGIKTAEISKIRRQRNIEHRAAVEDLSNGNVREAFKKLDNIGAIKTVDPLKPNQDLVDDYISTVKKGKSVLVVSPTHKQGNAVTADIRARLRSAGRIGKKELAVNKLVNANLTEAEKTDWRNYQAGQIIQFEQNVPQFKRGSAWAVQETDEKAIILIDSEGKTKSLPLDRQKSFNVYRMAEIGLSKGDKVRITKNGFDEQDKRLNNGTSLEVLSVTKSGKAMLINPISKAKFSLDKSFGHIDHDYCTTSHTSQGKTVDEVLISQPVSTFNATNAKQFYVSVSRARDMATIYTDDRESLLDSASEIGDRKSAIELVEKYDLHLEHIHHIERDKLSNIQKQDVTVSKEGNNGFETYTNYEQ